MVELASVTMVGESNSCSNGGVVMVIVRSRVERG